MDITYATVLGIGISSGIDDIRPDKIGFLALAIIPVFEDLYLYYNDANPEDDSYSPLPAAAQVSSALDNVLAAIEISIVACWMLAAIEFPKEAANYFLFFGLFCLLKTIAGYILYVREGTRQIMKAFQESVFLFGAAVSFYFYATPPEETGVDFYGAVVVVFSVWLIQTMVWWRLQHTSGLSYKAPIMRRRKRIFAARQSMIAHRRRRRITRK